MIGLIIEFFYTLKCWKWNESNLNVGEIGASISSLWFLVTLTPWCQRSTMAVTRTLSSSLVHCPPWLCVSFTYRWSLWHFAKRTSDSLSSVARHFCNWDSSLPVCLFAHQSVFLSLLLLMLCTFSFVLHLKARNCTPSVLIKSRGNVCQHLLFYYVIKWKHSVCHFKTQYLIPFVSVLCHCLSARG